VRRLALVLTAGALWLFLFAIPAFADNGPHHKGQFNTSLQGSCAGCHRAHSAQDPNLLKDVMPNLCYACHGSGATGSNEDVVNGVPTGGVAGVALRGGGFAYALIDTDNSMNTVWNGATPKGDSNKYIGVQTAGAVGTNHHSVAGTPVNMWGSGVLGTSTTPGTNTYTVTTDLTCGSCHDPHGNGQYRILKSKPDDAATTYAVYLNDVAAGDTPNYKTQNYGVGNVDGTKVPYQGSAGMPLSTVGESPLNVAANSAANGPTGSVADGSAIQYVPASTAGAAVGYFKGTYVETVSRWCATCHTRYFGTTGSAGNKAWTVTGSGDETFKFLHATRSIVDPNTSFASVPVAGAVQNPIGAGAALYSQIKGLGFIETDRTSGLPTGWVATSAPFLGNYTSSGTTFLGVAVITETYNLPSGTAGVDYTPPSTIPLDGTTQVTSALRSATASGMLLAGSAPRCITCHVSHGSPATDALGQPYGPAPQVTRAGETSLVTGLALHSPLLRLDGRGVCQNCHTK
jgi:predicted CXXCH cytochrome family protein